jgi:hypothetical protein
VPIKVTRTSAPSNVKAKRAQMVDRFFMSY